MYIWHNFMYILVSIFVHLASAVKCNSAKKMMKSAKSAKIYTSPPPFLLSNAI